jgi:chromosome segregation ATPase
MLNGEAIEIGILDFTRFLRLAQTAVSIQSFREALMRRWTCFAVTLLFLPAVAVSQSGSSDSQTLQALLAEIRQLRLELRTATVAAQRAQILIYRVQTQQAVVTRLSQRLDNDRSRLTQNQSEQKRLAPAIKHLEDLRDTQSESERKEKQTDEQLTQMKLRLEQLVNEDQESQPRKIELEEELRVEQTKLAQLHDELDRIDKALEQTARVPANSPQ